MGERADRVLAFSDLPDSVSGPYAAEWEVIRPYLCKLDESSRATRNEGTRTAAETGAVNYAGRVDFDSILEICSESGDDVVVGFDGGAKALASRDLPSLQARLYKWDKASRGSGRKGSAQLDSWLRVPEDDRRLACAPACDVVAHARSPNIQLGRHSALPRHGRPLRGAGRRGRGRVRRRQEAFLKKRLVDLKRRSSYKWDFTENLAGKRRADWILGSEVVEMLAGHHQYPWTSAEQ